MNKDINGVAPHIGKCSWCDAENVELDIDYDYELCKECESLYHNKTGHCSFSCCMGNGCDDSC